MEDLNRAAKMRRYLEREEADAMDDEIVIAARDAPKGPDFSYRLTGASAPFWIKETQRGLRRMYQSGPQLLPPDREVVMLDGPPCWVVGPEDETLGPEICAGEADRDRSILYVISRNQGRGAFWVEDHIKGHLVAVFASDGVRCRIPGGTRIRRVYAPAPNQDHTNLKQENDTMSNQLFAITPVEADGQILYGSIIATTKNGDKVVETRGGSGAVITVPLSRLTEVIPYSVNVRYLSASNSNKAYAFWATEGQLAVGDIVVLSGDGALVEVVKIDTKSKAATKTLVGRKLITDQVGDPAEALANDAPSWT